MPRLPRRLSRPPTRPGGLEALEGRSLLSGFAATPLGPLPAAAGGGRDGHPWVLGLAPAVAVAWPAGPGLVALVPVRPAFEVQVAPGASPGGAPLPPARAHDWGVWGPGAGAAWLPSLDHSAHEFRQEGRAVGDVTDSAFGPIGLYPAYGRAVTARDPAAPDSSPAGDGVVAPQSDTAASAPAQGDPGGGDGRAHMLGTEARVVMTGAPPFARVYPFVNPSDRGGDFPQLPYGSRLAAALRAAGIGPGSDVGAVALPAAPTGPAAADAGHARSAAVVVVLGPEAGLAQTVTPPGGLSPVTSEFAPAAPAGGRTAGPTDPVAANGTEIAVGAGAGARTGRTAGLDAVGPEAGAESDPAASVAPSAAAELIASFSPFERGALERSIDQFLDRLAGLDADLTRLGGTPSLIPDVLAAAATVFAAETVRRRLRRPWDEDEAADGGGDPDHFAFPGLPGPPGRLALEEL